MNLLTKTTISASHFMNPYGYSKVQREKGHGLLYTRKISEESLCGKPSTQVYLNVIQFLRNLSSTPETRNEFYAKMMGSIGTIYRGPSGLFRIDIQSPKADAQNIQVQWENITLATVVVPQKLFLFDSLSESDKAIQRCFAKYVLRQMIGAVKASCDHKIAVVLQIYEKPRLSDLIPY